jgi:hypothetical protein
MSWLLSHDRLTDLVPALALLVSLCALVFTIYKGRYDQRVSVKPVLVFVYDRADGWTVQNIGSGPALNVIVATHEAVADEKSFHCWMNPTRIAPLKKDGGFNLHWIGHDNVRALGATCEDIWDRPYSTTCAKDLNRVKPGRIRRWAEGEIVQEWTLRRKDESI